MELMQEVKGYSDSREEEEEEEAAEIIRITGQESSRLHQQDVAASNLMNQRKQLDFMELSLGSNKEEEANNMLQKRSGVAASASNSNTDTNTKETVEKEHMFDKVVTPSDVGKLNRLVIPKQHAEKYFPLDSSSNEKGLLLNFEDRNGKLWRFRYSYWNSSQSYVMTKGWSRFVKEKKLDAGDIVSFQRGLGELYRHRLYIDWRRRPDHVPHLSNSLLTPFFLPNHNYPIRCLPPTPRYHDHFHHHSHNNNIYAFHNHSELNNSGSGSAYYMRSPTPSMSMGHQNLPGQQQERGNIAPMIIDSVPVAHHHNHHHGGITGATPPSTSTGKRLRLFGVNMECASSPAEESKCLSSTSAARVPVSDSLQPLQRFSVPHEHSFPSSARFGDQRGGGTSVLFDLDPSL